MRKIIVFKCSFYVIIETAVSPIYLSISRLKITGFIMPAVLYFLFQEKIAFSFEHQ